MKGTREAFTLAITFALGLTGCDSDPARPALTSEPAEMRGGAQALTGPYDFSTAGAVFDIAASPSGNILVAVTELDAAFNFGRTSIQEIGRRGISEVTEVPAPMGSPINGLEPIGQRNFFVTAGGQDLAVGAGLWRVSQGNARLVADIEAFTLGDWPHGDPGPHPEWKDFRCELPAGFGAGPQTNPYHLTALSGGEVLIGDAANNLVLSARTNGTIEVVARIDPPLDPSTGEWMILLHVDEDGNPVGPGPDAIPCYVEPVPTAVAIGPDGAYYVSELTGATPAAPADVGGLSRVWRIEPGARGVRCPSAADCTEVVPGLTAVIDLEFGPEGRLYVVEFDANGWLAGIGLVPPALGAIKSCDIGSGECEVVEGGLLFPSAITFDKWNDLWLVENVFAPTVRRAALP